MSENRELGEMEISEVLARWPETARVFHEHEMACVGCVVAPFYTITDAANVYGIPPADFIAALAEVIKESEQEQL